jgi:methylmalonyl-CoA mutase, C-terminal domain
MRTIGVMGAAMGPRHGSRYRVAGLVVDIIRKIDLGIGCGAGCCGSWSAGSVAWGADREVHPRRYHRCMAQRPIKVLIAKPGLDGHDRGAKVLARGLRDEGFEVVYTGIRQTPEMIVSAAVQEDVDVVGLSILSGAHLTLLPRITGLLRTQGMTEVLVTAGGIIPDEDVPELQAAGVAAVFGPGTSIGQVADYLRANVRPRDA